EPVHDVQGPRDRLVDVPPRYAQTCVHAPTDRSKSCRTHAGKRRGRVAWATEGTGNCQSPLASVGAVDETNGQSLYRSCKVHALRRIIRTGSRAVRASSPSAGRPSRSAMTFARS